MQIIEDFRPYASSICELENKYLTGTIKELDSNASVIVAVLDNKLIGYLYYSLVLDEAEIISICIEPEFRHQGVGSKLFSYLADKGVAVCYLDVKETNSKAISFYTKLGFKEYLRRSNYYSDNSNAILMKWSR